MSTFNQQLEKVLAYFKPENLARQIIKYEGEVALLVIDVQKEFCDPNGERGNAETGKISERIQSMVPEFRKAGIPVYVVYFSRDRKKKASEVDFYKFAPDSADVLVAKNSDSAFEGSDIGETLKKDKRKLLITCGFNLNACVKRTVLDARKEGFDVCLLRDLTGNDNLQNSHPDKALETMREEGVTIEESSQVLAQFRAQKYIPAHSQPASASV